MNGLSNGGVLTNVNGDHNGVDSTKSDRGDKSSSPLQNALNTNAPNNGVPTSTSAGLLSGMCQQLQQQVCNFEERERERERERRRKRERQRETQRKTEREREKKY